MKTKLSNLIALEQLSSDREMLARIKDLDVFIVANGGGHNYGDVGSVFPIHNVRIEHVNFPGMSFEGVPKENGRNGNHIRFSELGVEANPSFKLKNINIAVSHFNKRIAAIEKQKKWYLSAQKFMQERGIEEVDLYTLNAHKILDSISGDEKTIDKARAIGLMIEEIAKMSYNGLDVFDLKEDNVNPADYEDEIEEFNIEQDEADDRPMPRRRGVLDGIVNDPVFVR